MFTVTDEMLNAIRVYPKKMAHNKFAVAAVVYPWNTDAGWDFNLAESVGKAYEIREDLEKGTPPVSREDIHIFNLMDL